MSEPANTDAAAATAATPKKKGKSKLLLLGTLTFILLTGGGAGAWWYFNSPADAAAAGHEEAEDDSKAGVVPLESFTVNLADAGGRKYLRANILLLVADGAEAKEVEENKLTISRMRSAVIEVLAKRTAGELLTAEGRTALKHDIAETAKEIAHLEVKDVLFEEFIVQ